MFEARGIVYHVEYINSYRDWTACLPKFATMSGAYRKRSIDDEKDAPHSFTFVRRESAMSIYLLAKFKQTSNY